MKKLLLLFYFIQCFTLGYGQSDRLVQYSTTAIPNKDAKFLLFPTKNIYIFLKLNTRTGEVYMVQYSLDGKESEVKIHSIHYPLVSKEEQSNGRFYLYPTTNIYNFLLLDQIDGRVWQVQWDFEEKNRFLTRIFNDSKFYSSKDSIKLKDLDCQGLVYYKDGERFKGKAFIDNEYIVAQSFFDGKSSSLGPYYCYHKNGEVAFIFDKDDLKDLSKISSFYDEEGNKLSLEGFLDKYSELLRKVKGIMGVNEQRPKNQEKKPSLGRGSKK